jgi:hypothetical protein
MIAVCLARRAARHAAFLLLEWQGDAAFFASEIRSGGHDFHGSREMVGAAHIVGSQLFSKQ